MWSSERIFKCTETDQNTSTCVCVWFAIYDFCVYACDHVCVMLLNVVINLQSGRGSKMALGERRLATADERAQALDVATAAGRGRMDYSR